MNLDQWNIDMFTCLRFKVLTVDVSSCFSYLFQVLSLSNCVGVTYDNLILCRWWSVTSGFLSMVNPTQYPLTTFLVKLKCVPIFLNFFQPFIALMKRRNPSTQKISRNLIVLVVKTNEIFHPEDLVWGDQNLFEPVEQNSLFLNQGFWAKMIRCLIWSCVLGKTM